MLEQTARYRHAKSYLESLAGAAGLTVVRADQVVLRYNKDAPVPGLLMILRKN